MIKVLCILYAVFFTMIVGAIILNDLKCLTSDKQKNLALVKQLARKIFPKNKILADLVVAQAIVESNLMGQAVNKPSPSRLASQFNNLFGIKGKQEDIRNGKASLMSTKEYIDGKTVNVKAWFRVYKDVEECFQARRQLFELPRYRNLFTATSFEDAAVKVQQDGYATDPLYSKLLIDTYNRYLK